MDISEYRKGLMRAIFDAPQGEMSTELSLAMIALKNIESGQTCELYNSTCMYACPDGAYQPFMTTTGMFKKGLPELMAIGHDLNILICILTMAAGLARCGLTKSGKVFELVMPNLSSAPIHFRPDPLSDAQLRTVKHSLLLSLEAEAELPIELKHYGEHYGVLQVQCPDLNNVLPGEAGYIALDQRVRESRTT